VFKADKVYFEIHWPLLLMFVGLFVVVAGLEQAVLVPEATIAIGRLHLQSPPVLAGVTAVLSNLVSNVPALLVLKPFVAASRIRSALGAWSPWPRRLLGISHWSDRLPISLWHSARADTASSSDSGLISRLACRSHY
jgi:hypothetical protein